MKVKVRDFLETVSLNTDIRLLLRVSGGVSDGDYIGEETFRMANRMLEDFKNFPVLDREIEKMYISTPKRGDTYGKTYLVVLVLIEI